MKKSLVFVAVFLGWVINAQGVTSPSSLKVKVLEMMVSKNSDCSNAISVFRTGSPTAMDLFTGPSFGSAVISTGTYHCVMFHVSDIVMYVPVDNSQAGCVMGTTYTFDIFQSGSADSVAPNGGGPIHASVGTFEDDPWIYFSDAASATTSQPQRQQLYCLQPTLGASNACTMAPFNVFSDQTRSLVMNFDNQLGLGGSCGTEAPILSVR